MITNSLTLWKLTIVLWYGLSICQNKHCLTWHFDLTNDQCLTVIISSGVLYIITIVKVEDSDLKCHSLTNTWKQAVIAYTLLVITVCHELYKLYSCHYWILLLTCTYMYCYFVEQHQKHCSTHNFHNLNACFMGENSSMSSTEQQ